MPRALIADACDRLYRQIHMRPVDLSPVRDDEQTQRPFDLFLIFVGASMVSTTLQVGASLPATFTPSVALTVIAAGGLGGAALVAALAPIGTRLRVPSIVAARAALGFSGAQTLALLLFITNFAWIALNNVIAASICAKLAGIGSEGLWATALGLVATVIVLGGPAGRGADGPRGGAAALRRRRGVHDGVSARARLRPGRSDRRQPSMRCAGSISWPAIR